jgi:hypothetical protein
MLTSREPAANDRRPVDPPPVVELRIFDGHQVETAKDITFNYNANFFVFATLEHARPIAPGRVQNPAANQPPVLTGMPVSGMAYLDRPVEAGYFLFPDLSVRHEGNYRLTFNLYEETKESKDFDADSTMLTENSPIAAEGHNASFDWRMEVRSIPFNVFSAKKFPGLAESTSLSRMVAEQGCRVRIRRDVRMRRRDGKPGGDYENPEEEYARSRRTQTPDNAQAEAYYRARSASAASDHRASYSADPQRRPSAGESYPPPPAPPYAAGQAVPQNYLHFGQATNPPMPHQYPPPPIQPAQPPPISPTTAYPHQGPHPQHQPQPQVYDYSSRPSSQQTHGEPADRRMSGTQVPPSPSRDASHKLQADVSSASNSILSPLERLDTRPQGFLPSIHSLLNDPNQSHGHTLDRTGNLAPVRAFAPESLSLAPTRNSLPVAAPMRMSNIIEPDNGSPAAPEPYRAGNKRAFEHTFRENTTPLTNGARPVEPHNQEVKGPGMKNPLSLEPPVETRALTYSRADGSLASKYQTFWS